MMGSLAGCSLDVPRLGFPALLEHKGISGAVFQIACNFLL